MSGGHAPAEVVRNVGRCFPDRFFFLANAVQMILMVEKVTSVSFIYEMSACPTPFSSQAFSTVTSPRASPTMYIEAHREGNKSVGRTAI